MGTMNIIQLLKQQGASTGEICKLLHMDAIKINGLVIDLNVTIKSRDVITIGKTKEITVF